MTTDIVSIEKVLNSRCSSQSEADPEKRHWGTLIDRRPQQKVINGVLRCCNIPRFSSGRLVHWFKDAYLFIAFEKTNNPYTERMLHVESGMQQQAVHLACAAQGIGTCIRNEGVNGTEYQGKIATAKHLIMEMADPYQEGKLTARAPGPRKPFRTGINLTQPLKDGDTECLPELERLTSFSKSGSPATERDISQLLWAAKGRTPHCIRIHVWNLFWGLTIPTWGGGQNLTSVYLMRDRKLFHYRSWTKELSLLNRVLLNYAGWTRGNPTHDIRFIRNIDIHPKLDMANTAIILCRNEKTARTLWEVGYMLENIFLQARSLDISYESRIFSSDETTRLAELGLTEAVAAVYL